MSQQAPTLWQPEDIGSGMITKEDIADQLNFIERLLGGLSAEDDYLAAILNNQKIKLIEMAERLDDQTYFAEQQYLGRTDTTNLPIGLTGIAAEDINSGQEGEAMFDIAGGTFTAQVEAMEPLTENNGVIVTQPGNRVNEGFDLLGALNVLKGGGGGGAEPVSADAVDRLESDTVTVNPGNSGDILVVSEATNLMEVGTTSNANTEYEYLVDGEGLFSDTLSSPLGLPNDLYPFPRPVEVGSEFIVRVTLDAGAGGSQDYIAAATTIAGL